jgi:hypothetical protein
MAEQQRVAEVGYSEQYDRVEIVLPHGTHVADLSKYWQVLAKDVIGRLPRGCPACLSGQPFSIRERFEHVVRVDLEKGTIIG